MKTLRLFLLAATALLPARPADIQVSGIPNFHQVNDQLFRGGQPSDRSWPDLAKLGVKTVIDLRLPDEHKTAAEARLVEAAGMRYINVPMKGLSAPLHEQIEKVLGLLNEGPVFVHCRRGADRTGTVMACYRIQREGWDNQKALREAKSYGMHWVEVAMKRYILAYRAPSVDPPAAVTAALP